MKFYGRVQGCKIKKLVNSSVDPDQDPALVEICTALRMRFSSGM